MKSKHIFFIVFLIFCNIYVFSQSSYYYYNGQKMPLEKDPNKISVILSKKIPSKMSQNIYVEATDTKTVNDTIYDIKVINLKDSKDFSLLRADLKSSIHEDLIVLPVYKNAQFDELIITNYLNIRLKKETDLDILHAVASEYNLEFVDYNELMPFWYTLSTTSNTQGTSLEVANAIFETGFFASSFPDFSIDGRECVSEPHFYLQWGLKNDTYYDIDISACSAWNYATGKGAVIAIIDQGINEGHPDLAPNMYHLSYDTETAISPAQVYGDHGTHCAGIAAAAINGRFIAGVAPDAKLMAVSNRLRFTSNYTRDLARGINWAWQNGADILSCSWRAPEADNIKEAIDLALKYGRKGNGAIFIKSAGNEYGGPVTFPGYYRPEVLTVSSIDKNGNSSDFSSIGNSVDVCAPGRDIHSTYSNNGSHGLVNMSGTSMACPHVSGVAALILEINPFLTGQEVRNIIQKNTKKVGTYAYLNNSNRPHGTWNQHHGYGLIDAHAAVRSVCKPLNYKNDVVNSNKTVNSECAIYTENVKVQSNAKLTLEAPTVTIEYPFEVTIGSNFEILNY